MLWVFFFLSFLFNYACTILSKQFGVTSNWWYAVLSVLVSAAGSITWSLLMRKGVDLSTTSPILSISLIITIVLTGFVFYGEPVAWNKIVGVILGIVAILLIVK